MIRQNVMRTTPAMFATRKFATRWIGIPAIAGMAFMIAPHGHAQSQQMLSVLPPSHTASRIPTEAKDAPTVSHATPTLKTGVFKNGMTYYILANPFPAKRAAMWLAVNAGAIQEDDDQLGYAHFLEHMAFNGTRNFPSNKLIDLVEQSGLSFGADLNAYTSFDQTVYQLTVPTDDPTFIRNGLEILHDWASGGMLMDSAEVARERGVVLGEWRQRLMDTVSIRLFQDNIARRMGANKYMHRLPIGTSESIERATVAPLKRFYQDWYRPDLMAVIIVGDVDPERMYQDVQRRFGSIPAATTRRPFARPEITPEARNAVHVVTDKVRPLVAVRWPNPIRATTPAARVREELTYTILLSHLNEMFARLSSQERRPFAAAQISLADGIVRTQGKPLELLIAMSPDSAQSALAYALGEIERVAQQGIPDDEFALAKSVEERRLLRAVDGSQYLPSRAIAERFVDHYVGSGDLLLTPEVRRTIGTKILASLTNADLQKAAAFWRASTDRSVILELPMFASVRPPTEEEVRGLFDLTAAQRHVQTIARATATSRMGGRNALPLNVTNITASSVGASTVPTTAAANAIVSETVDKASGVVVWTLRNGARVVFKQTANNPDEVIVHAWSPGGYSKLPDSLRLSSGRLIADLLTASGSTDSSDHTRSVQRLSTLGVRRFAVNLSGLWEEMVVAGSSRNPEILFSTMYKQFVDPYIDSTAFEEWKRTGGRSITYSQTDQFLFSLTGDRRLGPPLITGMQLMNLEKGLAVYKDRFGDASDFTFYVVGAIPKDSAKVLASRYLASLPSTNRRTPESQIVTHVRPLTGHIKAEMEHPRLQAVQASAGLSFSGYFPQRADSVLAEEERLQAVSLVLGRRLRNKLREEMSVTYGAGAPATLLRTPKWYYSVGIQFMASPEDIHRSVDSTWQVIRTLKRDGPTSDELAMVAKIHQRRQENARQSNAWWVAELQKYDFMGAPFSKLAETAPEPIDAATFTAAMERLFSEESYSQNIAVPTKNTLKKAEEEKAKQEKGAKFAKGLHLFDHSATIQKKR